MAENIDCPPRVKELVEHTISKLNTDCTNLIGRSFGISKPSFELITLEDFFSKNKENFFMIRSELEDSYDGHISTIIHIKDAIKIGGALLGYDDNQIKEKISKEVLDEEYTDGIKEFSNQFTGIIDKAFRNKLPKPVHVKLSSCTAINEGNAKDIFADISVYECIHIESLLFIKGFDAGKFAMFIPAELTEEFYGELLQEKTTNVLVIDDSITDIKIIKKYLSNSEFRVFEAKNSIEGFTLLHKEKIHLILLDLFLEEENGIEICQKIKKTPYTKIIPIIMISAKPTQTSVMEALQAGARDFLVKPFSKSKLLSRVNKFKVKKKKPSLF